MCEMNFSLCKVSKSTAIWAVKYGKEIATELKTIFIITVNKTSMKIRFSVLISLGGSLVDSTTRSLLSCKGGRR